jgi:CRP-like cAMP-binding protein
MAVANMHLKESEFLAISHALRMVAPLSEEDLFALLTHTRRRDMKRGETFLKAGERASTVAFVMQGGMREYYVFPPARSLTSMC